MKKSILFLLFCFMTNFTYANPPPADKVFQVEVKVTDPNNFSINWDIKPGYFLYSDRIKLTQEDNNFIHLGALRLPPTETKTDKQGRTYTVYKNQLSIPVSVLSNNSGETLVKISYQGCSDDGYCYPPQEKEIKLTVDNNLALSQVELETLEAHSASQSTANNKMIQVFDHHSWYAVLLIFYGFGLLLAFTPCILPMVPVLSGIIVGHGNTVTTRKAFFLSLSYVVSMSLTYALFGAVVALLGANIQISMQSPWVISIFSLIFVLLAFSMFGFYEFKLPASWQSKIAGSSQSHRGGHYWGAALMGALSTLILSPCVTAPLIAVLTYIAQSQNIIFGTITLFILGLGMGTPLLLIGTSAGKWLPETGSWMNAVKAFFGILFIGIAIYLMGRVIPAGITMGLWGSLLIFTGIYAGALTPSFTGQEKFYQGVGIILLGYGLLILIGASMGSTNPMQPLGNLQAASANKLLIKPKTVQTLEHIKKEIAQAAGKPIMLDFYADWCASCKIMEETTFKDPQVVKDLSRFEVIKVDLTANNEASKAIMNYFNIVAPPAFIFYNAQGEQLDHLKLVGEISADEFLKTLNNI